MIKNGNVVEQGSHDVLISNPDGVYSSLIRRQMETQKKFDSADSSFVSEEGSKVEEGKSMDDSGFASS